MSKNIPEYANISTMAKMLGLSRSRLYQLMDQGVLLKPIYIEDNNRRPAYTKEMIERNLQVKVNNVGINGQVVMFYSQRSKTADTPNTKQPKRQPDKQPIQRDYQFLIEDLKALGLEQVCARDIEQAMSDCFPNGTADIEEDETLTAIFRYLKRQNSEHKPRT